MRTFNESLKTHVASSSLQVDPMRIAVSGTHCSGKSTLIEEFLSAHTDFKHELEPYEALVEDYGEEFSAEPCADDLYRQLEFNVDRLSFYKNGDKVIFERSPIDFHAYILALRDLRREDVAMGLLEAARQMVARAITNLDLIVYLPLDEVDGIGVPDEEDPQLRQAVDARLEQILTDDEFDLSGKGVLLVEARGTTAQRLRTLEESIGSLSSYNRKCREVK